MQSHLSQPPCRWPPHRSRCLPEAAKRTAKAIRKNEDPRITQNHSDEPAAKDQAAKEHRIAQINQTPVGMAAPQTPTEPATLRPMPSTFTHEVTAEADSKANNGRVVPHGATAFQGNSNMTQPGTIQARRYNLGPSRSTQHKRMASRRKRDKGHRKRGSIRR